MKLAERLRRDAEEIWGRIKQHPFVLELYRGTLPLEKFKYYVIQDYNYLVGMAKAFSLLAAKAERHNVMEEALQIAFQDASIEMRNYEEILGELGLSLSKVLEIEPAPTNTAYTNHMIATCCLKPPIDCMVAMIPCFWTYLELAETHRSLAEENRNKLYLKWIKAYESEEYRSLTERLIRLVNEEWNGERYSELRRIFLRSSRYELMFWDMAYRLEAWP